MSVGRGIASLVSWARRRWWVTLVAGSLVVGVASLFFTSGSGTRDSHLAPILAVVLSVQAAVLGLLVVLHVRVKNRFTAMRYDVLEIRSFVNIRPLSRFPLTLGEWAIDPVLAEKLVDLVLTETPSLVVECGSGSSTLLIAACLRETGRGQLLSVEHNPSFRARTLGLLEVHGLLDWATVELAPLQPTKLGDLVVPWYVTEPFAKLKQPIDLLFVDGPPGDHRMARYPAVPVLGHQLSEGGIVVLDDGRRADEGETARLWSQQLHEPLEYLDCTHGAWIIRRNPANA